MFKKLLWKFFPPREISYSELESAYNTFENMRKNRYQFNTVYPSDLNSAFMAYERLVEKQRDYEEYVKLSKM